MSETTFGKLKNIDGGKELKFSMNPVDFRLSKTYQFEILPCQAQPTSGVAFQTGTPAQLAFELIFDQDVDRASQPKEVEGFLRSLNVIHEKSRSVPQVEFSLGAFSFKGYVSQVVMEPFRFNPQAEMTAVKVSLTLISSGEYEHGAK